MATTTASTTDRIERQIRLPSPRARVWRAITEPAQFSKWFGVNLSDPFVPGATVRGQITIKGYQHVTLEMVIDTVEPERRFAYRWHPYAVDPDEDYSKEPMTLVAFTLEEDGDGTLLTVVESGFDRIPASRRAIAFEKNSAGWEGQTRNIERYLAG